MSTKPIATARLTLRAVTPEDVPRIAELGAEWDVASMTARMPYPYTEDSARQWIDSICPRERVFAVVHDGHVIGVAGYTLSSEEKTAEIGYWLGKPYWGQGFATEAARALISRCFRKEAVEAVTCGHFVDNPGSARVIEKLGFSETGTEPYWCEARRMDKPAKRYRLSRPEGWLRLAVPKRLSKTG